MTGVIAALFRHPIKGFTPEPVASARLAPGEAFPGDRLYAVENGPSGFDPAAPAFIPKSRFTVLASIAEVALVQTRLDASGKFLHARFPGATDFEGDLGSEEGKGAFAKWLTMVLGEAAAGPLKVVNGGGHRFLDHPLGHVSVLNLASLRDMEARLGRRLDPARLRANVHVEGWPAWAENDWSGRELSLGDAAVRVFKPITRCAAPGVDPATAARDVDFTGELHRLYGHMLCGIYVQVERGGTLAPGDRVTASAL
jgi:uncharacterized protein YcbX